MLNNRLLISRLAEGGELSADDWTGLFGSWKDSDRQFAAELAWKESVRQFGRIIRLRGLLEITNVCKNDCYYCGIRRSNSNCTRYRLTPDEIINAADAAYSRGYRTIVMQGGEEEYFNTRRLCDLIRRMKSAHGDCVITLSLGERDDYAELRDAGADRYLLRHETADEMHYSLLHPAVQSWRHRMDCLNELKRVGFEVGCGFMVGAPGQGAEQLAKEMVFLKEFQPSMVGIGPFIPHKDTPFALETAGSVELTLFCLSLIRLMLPKANLPATTALATMRTDGYKLGILAGANVIMPNVSPDVAVDNYKLYDNVHVERTADDIRHSPLAAMLGEMNYGIQ